MQVVFAVFLAIVFGVLLPTAAKAADVNMLFATTRFNEQPGKVRYGGLRHLDLNGAGSIEYGTCKLNHPGKLAKLDAISGMQLYRAATKANYDLWQKAKGDMSRLSEADFSRTIKEWTGNICIFTHGYDESFEEAMMDGAALADEVTRRNPSKPVLFIVFTWPSLGSASEYNADEANVNWSADAFRRFLYLVVSDKNAASNIDVVTHSMGAKLIFACLDGPLAGKPILRDLILASPDFDFHTAEDRKADLQKLASRMVYVLVSDRDGPLITSQLLHAQPRLGRPMDAPTTARSLTAISSKSFWQQMLVNAGEIIVQDALNDPPDVKGWLAANPSLERDFGPTAKFIDLSDVAIGDFGHRMSFGVVAGLMMDQPTFAPFGVAVVHKRPDRLTLGQMGGRPQYLYRYHKLILGP